MFLLITSVIGLAYQCDYPAFGEISKIKFLYKEDNISQVKWLDTINYCNDKGNPTIYLDAGQGKCENSRELCYWNENEECLNTFRGPDSYQECLDLWVNNVLVEGLDNGRLPVITSTDTVPTMLVEEMCQAQFIVNIN
jgi:hypothetical protein